MINQEEINKAIEALTFNKQKAQKISFFGEDNHESIDAMIDVLENKLSIDDIDDKYSETHSYTHALDARDFLDDNEVEIDDLLFPENI